MQLIPVTDRLIGSHQVQTVNARELHEFLGNKRQFSDWVKQRIGEYKFIENQDFVIVSQNCETITKDGQRRVTVRNDYFVSLTMAKELAMVERTDKGREARQYFIDCERQLYELTLSRQTKAVSKNANWHLTQVINTLKTTVHNQQKAMDKIVSLHERSLELQALSLELLQRQTLAKKSYRQAVLYDVDCVFDLVEQGYTNAQISEKLGLSTYAISRIKNHRYSFDNDTGRLSYH